MEPQFASAFAIADHASQLGQRTHLRLLRLELAIVIAAGLLGVFGNDVARITSAMAFLVAIVLRATRISSNPEATWQDGRAAAESVKTLCWRYAVCASPFEREVPDAQADREFIKRLDEIIKQVAGLPVSPPSDAPDYQITTWMRQARASWLEDRQELYRRDRIDYQRLWYRNRAAAASSSNRRWSLAVLLLECAGADFAVASLSDRFTIAGTSSGALLGVVAALIAAVSAWGQARQFGALASAYTIAHQELTSIRGLLGAAMEERAWSEFVDSAEGAISREHTMWRASRQGRSG